MAGLWLILALAMLLSACASRGPAQSGAPGTYTVVAGDTLHKIARQHGQNVDALMRLNNLRNPNQIRVGQVLRVRAGAGQGASTAPQSTVDAGSSTVAPPRPVTTPATALPKQRIALAWPAQGTVNRTLARPSPFGLYVLNKEGTPVKAVADGQVIYADNGLRGYGNLIIVRHASNYLSIYAHNRRMIVKEGQPVKQGQTIAEMGSTESRQVGLYFELRYNGKATDAFRLLPNR